MESYYAINIYQNNDNYGSSFNRIVHNSTSSFSPVQFVSSGLSFEKRRPSTPLVEYETLPKHLFIDEEVVRLERSVEALASLKFANVKTIHQSTCLVSATQEIKSSNTSESDIEEHSDMSEHPGSSQDSDEEIASLNLMESEGKGDLYFGSRKAPNGSACERHKRWKKRCPDNCSFKQDSKGTTQIHYPLPLSISYQEDPVEKVVHQTEKLIAALHNDNWETAASTLFNTIMDLKSDGVVSFDKIESKTAPSNRFECMEMVTLVMSQLQNIQENRYTDINASRGRRSMSPTFEGELCHDQPTNYLYTECSPNGKKRNFETLTQTDSKKTAQYGTEEGKRCQTIACEFHTVLHARCPTNCPDRRPARARESVRESTGARVIKKPRKNDESSSESESESERAQDGKKYKKIKSRKFIGSRVGRKYLPQACENHKLLHARCPANCPDRLARDAAKCI
jgi:hypothetical protein